MFSFLGGRHAILRHDDRMIAFVRLERDLLARLELLLFQLVHLACEDGLGLGRAVDAICLQEIDEARRCTGWWTRSHVYLD